ncbi:MAG TPA: hypothetical protein VG815_07745 [Chloroflexota bacterium]|jgi:transcriptional regulator with XRE-family HTH domain|nr:hypothetical protein [Chloroflexota bacterium]
MLNGRPRDVGETTRRHIIVEAVERIGKEANRYEEQLTQGYDRRYDPKYSREPDAQVDLERLRKEVYELGLRSVAVRTGLDPATASRRLRGKLPMPPATLRLLALAVEDVRKETARREQTRSVAAKWISEQTDQYGPQTVAGLLGASISSISQVRNKKRLPSDALTNAVEKAAGDVLV